MQNIHNQNEPDERKVEIVIIQMALAAIETVFVSLGIIKGLVLQMLRNISYCEM